MQSTHDTARNADAWFGEDVTVCCWVKVGPNNERKWEKEMKAVPFSPCQRGNSESCPSCRDVVQITPLLGKYTLVRELEYGYTSTSYAFWNKKLALIRELEYLSKE